MSNPASPNTGQSRPFPDRPPAVGPAPYQSQRDPLDLVSTRALTRHAARRAARIAGRPVQG
jgi:hypothetical protein